MNSVGMRLNGHLPVKRIPYPLIQKKEVLWQN